MDLTEFIEKHQALTNFLASDSPRSQKGAAKIAESLKEVVEPLKEWVEDLQEKVVEAKQSVEELDEWAQQLATGIENVESVAEELEGADPGDREGVHSDLVAEAEAILETLGAIGAGVDTTGQ